MWLTLLTNLKNTKMKISKFLYLCTIILFLSACADNQESDITEDLDLEVEQRDAYSCITNCVLPVVPSGQNFSSGVDIDVWSISGCYYWSIEPSGRLDKCGKISVKIFDAYCGELNSFQVNPGTPFYINYNDYPSTYCGSMIVYMQNKCGYTINCLYNDCVPKWYDKESCWGC